MKKCSKCKVSYPMADFRKNSTNFDGRNYWCRHCVNAYQREWRVKNREKSDLYARMGRFRRNYAITIEDYQAMLVAQNHKCAICLTTQPQANNKYFHVDHDHQTGIVRGLLCGRCNRGIGYFADDVSKLESAIKYLLHEEVKDGSK